MARVRRTDTFVPESKTSTCVGREPIAAVVTSASSVDVEEQAIRQNTAQRSQEAAFIASIGFTGRACAFAQAVAHSA